MRVGFVSVRVCAFLLWFILLGGFLSELSAQMPFRFSKTDFKMVQTLGYITGYYVDTVDTDKLVDDAIVALLNQLDPHSSFISADDAADVNSELEGHFDGIGVEFSIVRDTLHVVTAIPDGPAEKTGVRAGDKIIAVDGENIAGVGITNAQVFKYLRGLKGTRVRIRNLRRQNRDTLEFVITRDAIPLHSVDAYYMARPTIGYVRVNRFAMNTAEELATALEELTKQGAKSLILDLRGNGGGVMQVAVQLASLFQRQGELVVYAQGRAIPKQEFFVPRDGGKYADMPLVVLVDEYSASASEIVSGSLQDWDRAVIIGRRTFGKGLVQNQIPLNDGSLLRITVARYYTPSGRMIQTPYELGNRSDYTQSFVDRYRTGEVFSRDSIHMPDSLRFSTLRTRRTVFGGGGIMPDVFVPIDTVSGSAYVNALERKGILYQWSLDYVDLHRAALSKQYPTFASLDAGFLVTDAMRDELLKLGAKQEIAPKDGVLSPRDEEILNWRIKAYVARSLFSFSDMVRVVNQKSDEMREGVRILEDWRGLGEPILRGGVIE